MEKEKLGYPLKVILTASDGTNFYNYLFELTVKYGWFFKLKSYFRMNQMKKCLNHFFLFFWFFLLEGYSSYSYYYY